MSTDYHHISYKKHSSHLANLPNDEKKLYETWKNEDTVDYWRHFRMIEPLSAILKQNANTKILTIGDGRYGSDSIMIKKINPSLSVLPTDIGDYLLKKAKQEKIIEDYKIENAEQLSFNEKQFYYTFCKESFHHFPRPYVALYEMLRVSQKGVMLIEPNEPWPPTAIQLFWRNTKNALKKILNKNIFHFDHWRFEQSGNYVFAVSDREIEKTALAINLPAVAFYYFNDYYTKGVEYEKSNSDLHKIVKSKISVLNLMSKLKLKKHNAIVAVLFKQTPDEELIHSLKKSGFEIRILPTNPYLDK